MGNRELIERLKQKRLQLREYIENLRLLGQCWQCRHALTIAEGRLLQLDMDIAEIEAAALANAPASAMVEVVKAAATYCDYRLGHLVADEESLRQAVANYRSLQSDTGGRTHEQ